MRADAELECGSICLSRLLKFHEMNYPTRDLELATVVFALKI